MGVALWINGFSAPEVIVIPKLETVEARIGYQPVRATPK
jgi:hypothetical protein